jgi:hypothetical protein
MQRSNDENPDCAVRIPPAFRDSITPKPLRSNRRDVLTRLLALPLLGTTAGCASSADARYSTQFWDEEVQLADGRIIWVQQGRGLSRLGYQPTYELYPTLATLKFFLPSISSTVIEWGDRFKPLILNVHDGKLYVGGHPYLGRHYSGFNRPRSGWVVQRYVPQSKAWERIPASHTPEPIRDTNLLMAAVPSASLTTMTLSTKTSKNFNGGPGWDAYNRRLDPAFRSSWSQGSDEKNLSD